MANMKNAGVREIIIDRCLQERRGYTIEQLMERVNKALLFDGLCPVTSGNTIRNDIENIANRWKQPMNRIKKGHAIYFSYKDPAFSIFNSQLTDAELRHLHSVLLSVKFLDVYQGCLIYTELSERLKDMLSLDCFQPPILLYENIPSKEELDHFRILYDCIRKHQTVTVSYDDGKEGMMLATVHPYFMRQAQQKWHLLGRDGERQKPTCLPICNILSVERDCLTPFVPNQDFCVDSYYDLLQ